MTPAECFAAGRARGLSKMEMQENLRGHAFALADENPRRPKWNQRATKIKAHLDYLDSVPDETGAIRI